MLSPNKELCGAQKQTMSVFSFIGKADDTLGKVSLFMVLLMRLFKTDYEP